jgi:hypothetical protein
MLQHGQLLHMHEKMGRECPIFFIELGTNPNQSEDFIFLKENI